VSSECSAINVGNLRQRTGKVTALRRRLPWLGVVILAVALVALAGRSFAAPFAAVVMDARTGEILHSQNHMTRLHPASLTKMMTLYIAFEALQNGEIGLDTMVTVSANAASEPPSRLGLRAGQRIAFRHLIRAAALRSGNDAATAIGEAISGSEAAFATRMTQTAAAMGMTHTRFRNAHGLTQEGHLSSARDMALLSRQLYFDFPQYYNIFSRRSEDAGVAVVRNTNSRFLDGYRGADGIKTGFTNAAGYNLAAMAERNGVRILVVVFGGRSVAHRHQQVVQLMDRGFNMAPARVATRRPGRPDYTAAAVATGVSAGRVIRLQTAPARSPFPRQRPVAPADPALEAVVATIQQGVEAALEAAEIAAAPAAAPAPAASPLPPARPEAIETALAPPEPDPLALAREAGFTTIAPAEFAEIAAPDPEPEPQRADTSGEGEEAQLLAMAQPVLPEQAEPAAADPAPEPDSAAESTPVRQFTHDEAEVARVIVQDGIVVIPGLPAIVTAIDPPLVVGDEPTQIAQGMDAPLSSDQDGALDIVAVRADPGTMAPLAEDLRLGPDGQILWRDEELLGALSSDANDPPAPIAIVLTASDSEEPLESFGSPMPEIVSRVSTAGVRLWSVGLGQHPSRFDAERTLLRLALTESGTLGSGQRRVVQRGGRYVALVEGLTEDQAALACLRLGARGEVCDVQTP
jgi:D-alanyl-D-alanine carboxypeptidase